MTAGCRLACWTWPPGSQNEPIGWKPGGGGRRPRRGPGLRRRIHGRLLTALVGIAVGGERRAQPAGTRPAGEGPGGDVPAAAEVVRRVVDDVRGPPVAVVAAPGSADGV